MTTKLFNAMKVILLAAILSFGLSYALAWTPPTATPPTGNISAPLNTSVTAQAKAGGLGIGMTTVPPSATKLQVSNGNIQFDIPATSLGNALVTWPGGSPNFRLTDSVGSEVVNINSQNGSNTYFNTTGGKVVIGATVPTQTLTVVGTIGATGDICTTTTGSSICLGTSAAVPAGAHAGCVLVAIDDIGTVAWKDRSTGADCPSFAQRCTAAGGASVDGSGNCVYTYSTPVATFGWGREIRNGDSQYICANKGGHPTWTYLSRTTTTHSTSCGGAYGLVYWNGTGFVNWGEFGGICGGNVTVDTSVTCKVPVSAI